jgi:hypothetical protein
VKRKAKLGPLDSQNSASSPVPDELQSWIDRVIVPILVQEFIRAKSLQTEANDG